MYRFFVLLLFAFPALFAVTPAELATARGLFEERRPGEAQQAFERLATAEPRNPEVNYCLGQLALHRNDHDQAVKYFEMAVAVAPAVGRYHHGLGEAYGRKAQHAGIFSGFGLARKCLAAYERAVALEPDNVDFRLCLFEFYRQAPGIVGGGFDKAVAQAAAMKRIDPLRGRTAFASLYAGEKKYREAFAEFDDILQANPDDFGALYQLGRLAALTGQSVDRGIAALRRCLELPAPADPHAPGHAAAHWRLGQLLEKKADSAGARLSYSAAVALDSRFNPTSETHAKLTPQE
jgi:tetratricopeptide (TPR) repeat protein